MDSRRQYRSIAFGTWKVGGARNFMARSTDDVTKIVRQKEALDTSLRELRGPLSFLHPSTSLGQDQMAVHLSSRLSPLSPSVQPLSPRLSPSQRSHSPRHFPSQQLHSPLSPSQQPVAAPLALRDDCYSSNEYVEYVGRRSNDRLADGVNGNSSPRLSPGSPLLSCGRKSRFALSLQRAHHRSASAGAESTRRVNDLPLVKRTMIFSPSARNPICADKECACSSSRGRSATLSCAYSNCHCHRKNDSNHGNTNTVAPEGNFLRGAKKFFKRIYSSATLPSKKNSSANIAHQAHNCPPSPPPTTPFATSSNITVSSFYRIPSSSEEYFIHNDLPHYEYREPRADYFSRVIDYRNELADLSSYSTNNDEHSFNDDKETYADSGLPGDERSSTPDESVHSMAMTSKSSEESGTETDQCRGVEDSDEGSKRTKHHRPEEIGNWNDLFLHLKRELVQMKERDAQILADLHKVESQLHSVRLTHFESIGHET